MHNVGVAFSRNLIADYPRASSVVFAAVGVYGLAFDWTDRNLIGTDKVMGTLIFGLLAVGCTGNLIRLLLRGHPATRLHRRPGRSWRAFHSEVVLPPSLTSSSDRVTGQRLSGVGLPLRPAGRPWMPMFVGVVGAALLFCGLFIGVSGTGVTGDRWARWVAMVLLGLPGALCIAGSVLVLAGPTITPADQIVLTPQGLFHFPRMYAWEGIGAIDGRWGDLRHPEEPVLLVDIWAAPPASRRRLVSLDVTLVPNPNTLVDALQQPLLHPELRARLAEPAAVSDILRVRPTAT